MIALSALTFYGALTLTLIQKGGKEGWGIEVGRCT